MPKNIVICCDGTNNQFSGHHTNVIRTYKVAQRSPDQFTFYDCGVGTMPEPWHEGELAKRWALVKGLAFGAGFMENIQDAYCFLMANYEPDDQVYLFGFSRGAYTARALAGLLYSVGLLHPGTENLIRYAQHYWRRDFRSRDPKHRAEGELLCEEFRNTLARPCPIHFIGVWDTVGSVGFINQFHTFPFTAHNPSVTHIRHAVSINEHRSCFRQNLMFQSPTGQDVKNVWFAGVHSDVGGGYHPNEAGLAKIAFEWMMREASLCGLRIDATVLQHELRGVGAPPDPLANQHDSLQGGWQLVELIPVWRYDWDTGGHRWRMALGAPRDLARHAHLDEVYLHQSVRARIEERKDYRPANLMDVAPRMKTEF